MKKLLALFLLAVLLIPSPAAYAAAMLSDTGTDDMEQTTYTDADAAEVEPEPTSKPDKASEEKIGGIDYISGNMVIGHRADGTVFSVGEVPDWLQPITEWTDIANISVSDIYNYAVGYREDGLIELAVSDKKIQQELSGRKDLVDYKQYADSSWGGYGYSVGLNSDGTMLLIGDRKHLFEVSEWKDIVSVKSYGGLYGARIVGLRADGTVVATGVNSKGQCNVSAWKNVKDLYIMENRTIGLCTDGSVYDTLGELSDWTDIKAIICSDPIYGLKTDGTVVFIRDYTANQNFNEKLNEVLSWTDIAKLYSGLNSAAGLKTDGTVVYAGINSFNLAEVEKWTDIIAIINERDPIIGLRKDGTVVFAGNNDIQGKKKPLESWTQIVRLWDCYRFTVGLKKDGSYVLGGISSHCKWTIDELNAAARMLPVASARPALSSSTPDGYFNYTILENEPGYLYDRFDDYWMWYAAYDEVYLDADVIIGIQLEGEVGGNNPAGATLYTKIMDKDGRKIDGVEGMIFLIDDVKYSFNEMPGEDGAMAGSVVLYKDGYEIVKAFAEAKEVSVKLKLFSGKSIILDLNKAEFNRTLGNMCKKIVAYNVWDYYLENPGVEMLEMMFPLEITRK